MVQRGRGLVDFMQQHIEQMFQDGQLQRCKVCGGEFPSVIKHALQAHDMSKNEYELYALKRRILKP